MQLINSCLQRGSDERAARNTDRRRPSLIRDAGPASIVSREAEMELE
jgi:hypothetical protein